MKRRSFLAGGSLLLLPRVAAAAPRAEPHFFLLVVLGGGADASYSFDARPLSMTAAGKIQNYTAQAPIRVQGRNGVGLWASPLAQPLLRLRDRFSILNGVVMAPGFDGHLQNMNLLMTGDPFGGESFVPHLNLNAPDLLDAVLPSLPVVCNVTNDSRMVPLLPAVAGTLAAELRKTTPFAPGDPLNDFIRTRAAANAQGSGRFAQASAQLEQGLAASGEMHRRLARLDAPDPSASAEQRAVALAGQCFRLGIARSAVYLLPENFDVHAPEQARQQPKLFASALDRVAALFEGLITTSYDARRSMLDVTTVMVATEFSRTLRSSDAPIGATGTHHNPFANTVLLGGKGVKNGLVIGATDLADETAEASPAHRAIDPPLEKTVGLPFDFATLRPRGDRSISFDLGERLTIASVINTLYALFEVPAEHRRSPGRNLPVAPTLSGLLA